LVKETGEAKSKFRCRYCGHFHANLIQHRLNVKFFPKRCQRCRKPYPLGPLKLWQQQNAC
jgi:hypothetical protein